MLSEEAYQRSLLGWSVVLWLGCTWILIVDVPILEKTVTGWSLALPLPMQALLLAGHWWPLAIAGLALMLLHQPTRGWVNLGGSLCVSGALLVIMSTFHMGIGRIGD